MIKMLWDFRGPGATKTAEHHVIHLKEFMARENREFSDVGVESINEFQSVAFLVVSEDQVPALREALKPHRGQRA